ncbi:MAG: glycosyltransferase family 2 protein [Alphaproteobacteria bacterium]|nr:glycosyltransferase family 2 protein [Alphaproteobacteria bacterium]
MSVKPDGQENLRHRKSVAILLCTKNGEKYLEEQLASYQQQTYSNWRLYVSDDGSTDNTLAIIRRFADRVPNPVEIKSGPGEGFVQNFLSFLSGPAITADYFAYSDQDDIWLPDKLERAIAWHETIPPGQPALYCGRVQVISADGRDLGLSPRIPRMPSFKNALVENIASGNTSVFNVAARNLLGAAGMASVVLHDWWTYQVVTACGGQVWYDMQPCLKYRQHKNNVIGANRGLYAHIRRAWRLCRGNYKSNINHNLKELRNIEALFANREIQEVLDNFQKTRSPSMLMRLNGLRETGVYRQDKLGNMGLVMAALLKKM